jgi:hypothetical protein
MHAFYRTEITTSGPPQLIIFSRAGYTQNFEVHYTPLNFTPVSNENLVKNNVTNNTTVNYNNFDFPPYSEKKSEL